MSESQSDQPSPDSLLASASAAGSSDVLSKSPIGDVPFQLTQEPLTPEGAAEEPAPGTPPAPAYEHLGELPATYGTQSLYLVAYDPRQLFAYWDVDWSTAPSGQTCLLRVHRADGHLESRVDVVTGEPGCYLNIEQPGGTYFVELGANGRDGQWRALAKSGYVTMPPEGIAGEMEPKFATLPFHLSFQRLVELLQHTMRAGDDLTDVLARLQQGGQLGATSLLGSLGGLSEEQLRTLETLLGESLHLGENIGGSLGGDNSEVSAAPGSEQNSYGRFAAAGAGGSENLSSGAMSSESRLAVGAGASEMLSSGSFSSESRLAAGAIGSENLSSSGLSSASRFAASAMGSETLSSGAMSSESRLFIGAVGSENLSSGGLSSVSRFAARGMGSETLSSGSMSSQAFLAAGAGGSENLSSYGRGLSSEAYAAAAARGSEMLSSAAMPGYGVSSEAWRRAAASGAFSSDSAASENALFKRVFETNLEAMSSLFSGIYSDLGGSGGLGGSSSVGGSASTGGSSELSSRGRW